MFLAAVMAAIVVSGAAHARPVFDRHVTGCHTASCDHHARAACRRSVACMRRVTVKREKREWAYYRAHPMPYCTWGPESGGDYTAKNPVSSAGGKFQMLDQTYHAYGGTITGTGHDAAYERPIVQERIARRVAYTGWRGTPPQGLGAWVNC